MYLNDPARVSLYPGFAMNVDLEHHKIELSSPEIKVE